MLTSAILFVSAMTPVRYLMDLQAASHLAAGRDEILVSMKAVKGGKSESAQYTIYRDGSARCAIDTTSAGLPLRRHIFGKDNVTVFEPSTKKYSMAKVSGGDNLAAVIDENLPSLDVFPKLLMLNDGMTDWGNMIAKIPGWTWVKGQPKITVNTKGVVGSMTLDAKTNRISQFVTTVQGMTITWTMQYRPLKSAEVFGTGTDSYQVAVLSDPGKMPKMDGAVKPIVEKTLRLYEPPKAVAFKVKKEGGWTTAQYTRKGIRQSSGKATVVYDGRKILVESKGKQYGGIADSEVLLDSAAKTGDRIEPWLKDLTMGTNPVRKLLEGTTTVKLAGSAKVSGEDCSLLQAKGPDYTLTLFVAKSDGFVLRINTSLPGGFQYSDATEYARAKTATESDVSVTDLSRAQPLSQLN